MLRAADAHCIDPTGTPWESHCNSLLTLNRSCDRLFPIGVKTQVPYYAGMACTGLLHFFSKSKASLRVARQSNSVCHELLPVPGSDCEFQLAATCNLRWCRGSPQLPFAINNNHKLI